LLSLHRDGPNLLCFPYAGAGPLTFDSWQQALPAVTVRYPEGAESVAEVVESLMKHLAPKLEGRFSFFGHSMGAGIAFEFTRALREQHLPLPAALFVSAATAPQLRTTNHPEVTEGDLLGVLRRIHGNAAPESSLRAMLPRFAPDARLHRRYVYREELPLGIPIYAYGGANDITVPVARMQPWAAQTTAAFRLRLFPGGHMYMDKPFHLLRTLRNDLHELLPG
jgi:medium-chain acyl-[acyl-carrier-protein] hydrolase